jgi:hypothetical protein
VRWLKSSSPEVGVNAASAMLEVVSGGTAAV